MIAAAIPPIFFTAGIGLAALVAIFFVIWVCENAYKLAPDFFDMTAGWTAAVLFIIAAITVFLLAIVNGLYWFGSGMIWLFS